jgi:recombination protein RecT
MNENLPAVQQKAIDLREYLQSNRIRDQLNQAVPKWLNVDRLLRIMFGAALKNPKILDCSKESILRTVMECAQLGLEPILGRAYPVPYYNSKKKVLELQLQVGYQGLVDLARRSNTISDVWGANVYENDIFFLTYGMDRKLKHTPWFMDPQKRENGQSGEIIGAYVVWQLKDGTKHPEFMPISDIHKRRDLSQAYRWAETGDPNRGGGKKDSIWHEWPEEQNLKTVIKHSSKLVPASIEFMQAVETDNELNLPMIAAPEKSRDAINLIDALGQPSHVSTEIDGNKPDKKEPAGEVVETMEPSKKDAMLQIIRDRLGSDFDEESFIGWCISGKEASNMEEIATLPNMQFVPLRDQYIKYLESFRPDHTARNSEEQTADAPPVQEEASADDFDWDAYVHSNLQKFFDAPPKYQAEAEKKWKGFYPNVVCPFAHKEASPPVEAATVSPESDPELGVEEEARENELSEAFMNEAGNYYGEDKAKALLGWMDEFAKQMKLSKIEALEKAIGKFASYVMAYDAWRKRNETNGVPTKTASVEDVRMARRRVQQLKQQNGQRVATAIGNLHRNRKVLADPNKPVGEMTIAECDAIADEFHELKQLEDGNF